ncbi:MAG: GNAT family N-acetyltransferase, partial [Flavobacteriales bacterium]
RVYLRPLNENDVNSDYLSWFADDDVTAFLEVNGKELTKEIVIEYIRTGLNTGKYFMYAICLCENDRHIGNLKVGPIVQKHQVADLPCVIGDKSQWGKGLATEAIAIGSRIAFEDHNIRKLTGQIYANNIGSIKAYCKAGWIIEGVNQSRYILDGKEMDQVIVSFFNPASNNASQSYYSVEKTIEWIKMRESFLSKQ